MRALLLHDRATDDGEQVAALLTGAGVDVVRCHLPGDAGVTCVGADGDCPLDGTVDVAVAVHDRPVEDLAPTELGVVCARRDGVPVVAAGRHPDRAAGGRADAVAAGMDDIVDACQRARDVSAARAAVLISKVAGTDVTVARDGNTVVVTLVGDEPPPKAAIKAHQAARALFRDAASISVRS